MSQEVVKKQWNGDDVIFRAGKLSKKSAWEIGLAVLSDAKVLCPVDMGYLAASLMAASKTDSTNLDNPSKYGSGQGEEPDGFQKIQSPPSSEVNEEVFVGTAVEYGPYMEFGTMRASARPFLRPALDMAKGKAPMIVQINARQEFAEYLNPKGMYSQTNEAFSE